MSKLAVHRRRDSSGNKKKKPEGRFLETVTVMPRMRAYIYTMGCLHYMSDHLAWRSLACQQIINLMSCYNRISLLSDRSRM